VRSSSGSGFAALTQSGHRQCVGGLVASTPTQDAWNQVKTASSSYGFTHSAESHEIMTKETRGDSLPMRCVECTLDSTRCVKSAGVSSRVRIELTAVRVMQMRARADRSAYTHCHHSVRSSVRVYVRCGRRVFGRRSLRVHSSSEVPVVRVHSCPGVATTRVHTDVHADVAPAYSLPLRVFTHLPHGLWSPIAIDRVTIETVSTCSQRMSHDRQRRCREQQTSRCQLRRASARQRHGEASGCVRDQNNLSLML
jgi:hypothetical protein